MQTLSSQDYWQLDVQERRSYLRTVFAGTTDYIVKRIGTLEEGRPKNPPAVESNGQKYRWLSQSWSLQNREEFLKWQTKTDELIEGGYEGPGFYALYVRDLPVGGFVQCDSCKRFTVTGGPDYEAKVMRYECLGCGHIEEQAARERVHSCGTKYTEYAWHTPSGCPGCCKSFVE
jgi:hypothetical protein